MRTHVEFLSQAFPPREGEGGLVNSGRFGGRLADFLAKGLPAHGFEVRRVAAEDFGWVVELKNDAFPLYVCCGNIDGSENAFLCFIEPSQSVVRRWLRKIDAAPVIERLAGAIESLLESSGSVSQLRWLSGSEAGD